MTRSQDTLRLILGPTGPDAGCDHSADLLDQVVEAELAGRAASEAFPEVATHLAACSDCREDHLALRAFAASMLGGTEDATGGGTGNEAE